MFPSSTAVTAKDSTVSHHCTSDLCTVFGTLRVLLQLNFRVVYGRILASRACRPCVWVTDSMTVQWHAPIRPVKAAVHLDLSTPSTAVAEVVLWRVRSVSGVYVNGRDGGRAAGHDVCYAPRACPGRGSHRGARAGASK